MEYIDFNRHLEQKVDGWYFWDETWSDLIGPFGSRDIACMKFEEYCDNLNRRDIWECCGVARSVHQRCSCGESYDD